jgi:polysaccharide chain length determinant protein (PEP-CTERM system associated)
MASEQQNPGLDRLLGMWNRRKWLATLVAVTALTATASIVLFLPDVYRSTVSVLVESQQVPQDFVKSTVTSAAERRVQTITQSILSRERLDSLIKRFGLYENLRARSTPEDIIQRMRSDISVEVKNAQQQGPGSATIAFTISYSSDDPDKAATVANTLASFFIEEDLRSRESQAGGTADFLRSQLDEIKKKLDSQEIEVSQFKESHLGELPEQRDANLTTLERLNTELMLNSEKQIRTREQKGILERQLANADSGSNSSRPDAVADKVAKLSAELADLRRRYSDKYPDVVYLKDEIARLQRNAADPVQATAEVGTVPDPYVLQLQQAIKSAEAELRVLAAEEANVHKSIGVYQERVENAPRREQQFQELSRDYNTTKEVYASLLKRYEEAKIAESMEYRQKGEQFRVLDAAIPMRTATAPRRGWLLFVSLAFALGLGAATIFVSEMLDQSFHSLDDLRAFSRVPVLASIPQIVTHGDARAARLRFSRVMISMAVALTGIIVSSYILSHDNHELVAMVAKLGGSSGQ